MVESKWFIILIDEKTCKNGYFFFINVKKELCPLLSFILKTGFQVFASLMKDSKEGDRNHSPALKS